MSRWLRRLGYLLGTLVVLVVALAGFVFAKSSSMMGKKYALPDEPISVVSDSATLARGKHLATVIGKCTECHGADFGGTILIPDSSGLGEVVASNLTMGEGGVGNTYTDAQMARTIRHGVKIDSTSTLIMPSEDFQVLSDEDVAALVAYIRSMPPVNRSLPKSRLLPLGRALSAFGQLPIFTAELVPLDRAHPKSVPQDTSLGYGAYMANVGGCTGCHGPTLSGGKIPGAPPEWPPAANLTPTGIGRYNDAQIETILRTGKRPDGSSVKDEMPWRVTKDMTPDEMLVTIKYLRSVPPKEFGGR